MVRPATTIAPRLPQIQVLKEVTEEEEEVDDVNRHAHHARVLQNVHEDQGEVDGTQVGNKRERHLEASGRNRRSESCQQTNETSLYVLKT